MPTTFDEPAVEVNRAFGEYTARENAGPGREVFPTVVLVNSELGSNNAVFIRGHGCGLSWDKGQPLSRLGPRTWIWSASGCEETVEFGLLLDDQVWARGANVVLAPGRTMEMLPDFEWPDIPRVANAGDLTRQGGYHWKLV